MARGKASQVGDTRVSPNGYHYTRTETKWELTHKLIAERKLGRPLAENERVRYKDGDRTNLSDDNIIVTTSKERTTARRAAQLRARIEELQAELEALERE